MTQFDPRILHQGPLAKQAREDMGSYWFCIHFSRGSAEAKRSPLYLFDLGRPLTTHNCSMATLIPARGRQVAATLPKNVTIALRWIGRLALATLLTAAVALCFSLVSLLVAAAFDPNVGCP